MTTWLRFINEEATDLAPLERILGKEFLRQILIGEAATNFAFPLEVQFKGVVTGRRSIHGTWHLEVAPAGLGLEAFSMLGGVLVPCDRALYPGSAVEVEASLVDPDLYDTDIGVLAEAASVSVLVPVEL